MVLVKLLSHFRLGLRFEIFIHALVIFVGASTVRDLAVTRGKILVLESRGKDGARLWDDPLAPLSTRPRVVTSTYIISHLVLRLDALGSEEVLERLLFLAAIHISNPALTSTLPTYRLMLENWCSF